MGRYTFLGAGIVLVGGVMGAITNDATWAVVVVLGMLFNNICIATDHIVQAINQNATRK